MPEGSQATAASPRPIDDSGPAPTGSAAALKDLRLEALRKAPEFLIGDIVRESGRTPGEWSRELSRSTWFVASCGGEWVGLGRLHDYPRESPRLHLEAMWVRPAYRRRGVGSALARFSESLARDMGEVHLGLWVVGSNFEAELLYKSLGYRPTGRGNTLEDGRFEVEYARWLDAPVADPHTAQFVDLHLVGGSAVGTRA